MSSEVKREDWETKINKQIEVRCSAKGCNAIIKQPESKSIMDSLCWDCQMKLSSKIKH